MGRVKSLFSKTKRIVITLTALVIAVSGVGVHNYAYAAASYIPVANTPHVIGNSMLSTVTPRTVNEYLRVGDYMYAVGVIDKVVNNGSSTQYTVGNIFRFNAATGVIDPNFKPILLGSNNTVEAGETRALEVSPDNRYLYIGGDFTTVNGAATTGIVKWDLQTNTRVSTFNPVMYSYQTQSANVNDIRYVNGQLIVASDATLINGAAGSQLMSLDPTTGVRTNYVNFSFTKPILDGGSVKVLRIAINPQNTYMVLAGNFREINAQPRALMALAKLSPAGSTLAGWYPKSIMQKTIINADGTQSVPSTEGVCLRAAAVCVRDISWSPSGTWFGLVTGGGSSPFTANPYPGISDTASRWDVRVANENDGDAKYTWLNTTVSDTFLSVSAREDYMYVGGHFKTLNANVYTAANGGGRVDSAGYYSPQDHYGIARINPVTGAADPYYNPAASDSVTSRGKGWSAMYFTTLPGVNGTGIWIGGDTDKIMSTYHRRVAFIDMSQPIDPASNCTASTVTWTGQRNYANGEFCLADKNGNVLIYQADGNLVWYLHGTAIWHSNTYAKGATSLILQSDGNVVIYNASMQPLYASSIFYNKTQLTTADQQKSLSVAFNGTRRSVSHVINLPGGATSTSALSGLVWDEGKVAAEGICVVSSSFEAKHLQRAFSKGQFCIDNGAGNRLVFQGDGNLVQYLNGKARWWSGTSGTGTVLVFQNDGNIVIYAGSVPSSWYLSKLVSPTLWGAGRDTRYGNGSTGVYLGTDGTVTFRAANNSKSPDAIVKY